MEVLTPDSLRLGKNNDRSPILPTTIHGKLQKI